MLTIGLDADDTLWENEAFFHLTQEDFVRLLADHADADTLRTKLYETEIRNLEIYGYGIKGFTLSMIQTALDLTGGEVPGTTIAQLLDLGQSMLRHPVKLLPGVEDALSALSGHRLILITKGDVMDQERKLASSNLADFFDRIEIVQNKTTVAYAAVLRRAQLEPDGFLMAGNSMKSDVLPVIELGGHGVLIPSALGWAHEDADHPAHPRFHQLKRIADLPGLVAQIEAAA